MVDIRTSDMQVVGGEDGGFVDVLPHRMIYITQRSFTRAGGWG